MTRMYRVIVAITCLIGAIACYVSGVPTGGAIFLALGLTLESLFWIGLVGRKKS